MDDKLTMRVNSGESHDRGKSTEDESPGHSISLSRCGVGGEHQEDFLEEVVLEQKSRL